MWEGIIKKVSLLDKKVWVYTNDVTEFTFPTPEKAEEVFKMFARLPFEGCEP
ncbi:MAG: hypothetical protein OEL89_00175 [Candidatus Peregrinibacteria bacterium]|nr:hypothetical protein [Candidatus Peregrinibacteria bacterium]